MVYPAEVDFSEVQLSLNLVKYTTTARKEMQMSNEEFLGYAKFTFFAGGGSVIENKKISIAGQEVVFEVSAKSIPKPLRLQLGIFELNEEEAIVIGFENTENFNTAEADKIFTEIISGISKIV